MIPAVSIATSVPAPIAMPTVAAASAGASFTPSPTIPPRRDAVSLKQLAITHQHGATAHGRLYAVARDGVETGGRIDDKRTLLGSFDNGSSEWVLRLRIRCSGEPENLCLVHAYRRNH